MLFYLCSILSKKCYLFFNILSSFDFPARTLLSFLQTAGLGNVNVAAICKLIQGHATITTSGATELLSWAALIEHCNCQLQSLSIQYDSKDNRYVDLLLDSLSRNTSIQSLKISTVIGQGFEAYHILEISQNLGQIMAKRRLQTLELSISSLEEGFRSDFYQPLVESLCACLANSSIIKLVLDMDLNSNHVLHLCQAVSNSSVQVLHLLHLSCQRNGFQALAALIVNRNLTGLDLSGCWTANSAPMADSCRSPSLHNTDMRPLSNFQEVFIIY